MAEIIAGVAMSHSPLIMTSEAGCWRKRTTISSNNKGNEEMVKR